MQDAWCKTPSGETVQFVVGDEQGGSGEGVRVFAGQRSDPFFFDVPTWFESVKAGRLVFKEQGTNALVGLNLLGLVVEIDSRPWVEAGRGPLFGVVGETIAAGRLPIRTERFGRPEIMNVCRLSASEIAGVKRPGAFARGVARVESAAARPSAPFRRRGQAVAGPLSSIQR